MERITDIFYLISAALFIIGLKGMSSPKTARRGNLLAMIAMLIAVVVTLFNKGILDFTYIIAGLIIGAAIGAVIAKRVQMTTMPQMVAIFNGLGGGASALVASAEYVRLTGSPSADVVIIMALSLLIGTVTFTGSLVAFAKLQGIIKGSPIVLPLHRIVNGLLLFAIIVMAAVVAANPSLTLVIIAIIIL